MGNIESAAWIDGQSGLLLMHENISSQELESMSGSVLWDDKIVPVQFSRASIFEVTETNGYGEENGDIVFVFYKNYVSDKKPIPLYLAGDINQWLSKGFCPEWQLKEHQIQGHFCFTLRIPKDQLPHQFQFKFVSQEWEWQPLPQFCRNRICPSPGLVNLMYCATKTGHHMIKFSPKEHHFQLGTTAEFHQDNHRMIIDDSRLLFSLFTDEKLGAWIDEYHITHFALFAPRIMAAEVLWKQEFDAMYSKQSMIRQENGIWSSVIDRDLTHAYYLFRIQKQENGTWISHDIIDPYAQALVGQNGPGIIMESIETKPHFQAQPLEKWVIYEGHVRDLIANVPEISVSERLNFGGLRRFLDNGYFRHLGINAIELQPIHEFDHEKKEDYHWGYMPINYFAPASVYGRDPQSGSQVREFRELIEAFHRQNIAVILDVVYNHVGELSDLHKIDPKYFFRQNDDGFLLNDSGCGNDLYTENPIVQRLILDSLEHFVCTYDVDGFRFDLAELVGLDFLDKARVALQKIKPSLVMIAEPWSFRGNAGHEVRKTGLLGWNDEYREFIRAYVLGQGNHEGLHYFIEGSLKFRSHFPMQSVNYLSSHDDRCWIDCITENVNHDGSRPTLMDIRRTHMALAILLLSLGIPMLGEGMELLHSKRGVNNTYQRGDLNALDYSRALEYPLTLRYVQQLIDLRMKLPLFCLKENPAEGYIHLFPSAENNAAAALLFNATKELGSEQILLVLNPYREKAHFNLDALKDSKFIQIADTFSFQEPFHWPSHWLNHQLESPPLDCSIWRKIG